MLIKKNKNKMETETCRKIPLNYFSHDCQTFSQNFLQQKIANDSRKRRKC